MGLWSYSTYISQTNQAAENPIDIASSLRGKAFISGSGVINSMEYTTIILPNESYDPGNHFENGKYTVSNDGYYDLRAKILMNAYSGDQIELCFFNDSTYIALEEFSPGANTTGTHFSINAILWLNIDDEITFQVYFGTIVPFYTRSYIGTSTDLLTYFSVEYLGS